MINYEYRTALQRKIDLTLAGSSLPISITRRCAVGECPHYRKASGERKYSCHRYRGEVREVEPKQVCLDGLTKQVN